jgi:D-alanyl-D-alanine carboxypeptidase
MGTKMDQERFNQLVNRMVDGKSIFSAVMKAESGNGAVSWSAAAGDMETDSRYFIASVTKLYITAIVMKLIEEKRLDLGDRLSNYLPEEFCSGLHILRGVDHSAELTIGHLITNTSGIPDYFFHKQDSGRTVADDLMEGKDEPWPLERTIELIKQLKPKFAPGKKGKAAYSDSNYQLLGKILERVTGKPIADIFHEFIFSPLGLSNSYIYSDTDDNTPVPFYYGTRKLWLPRYMTSVGPEGGVVSTAGEVMIFLKEFFAGRFFPKVKIDDLKRWNMIYPPPGLFMFGVGLEKLWIPKIAMPFNHPGEILGFWGQTGSFAFYNPKRDIYLCGTTNQINGTGHRKATGAMIKVIKRV